MSGEKRFPEEGDFVICNVKRLNPNSAEVDLIEFPGVRGMIHVSELANTWVRNINRFVKIGQVVVVKVMRVDKRTSILSVSLKRVKLNQKREKISDWKNEKKAENFMKIAAKEMKVPAEKAQKTVGEKLRSIFGQIYPAFELASKEGAKALEAEGIDSKWARAIAKVAVKNIKAKAIIVRGTILASSTNADGLKTIKEVLDVEDDKVKIRYISAPKYSIEVHGKDYPSCEKKLSKLVSGFEAGFKKAGMSFEFSKS